ncbi:hypothetical protein BATDEDRAFT_88993 [Batrachochytrium dendrobatidis JAM81]|uniref:Nucleoporin p58/p45 n=1 Tax=Batrachochytrium dendrobatidis (strain JAM81 / FGSC 10211) TaxID=684364 RepID=F4P3W4_BATDJ|nr:uncharacterized protein BATDEDRAFT_88993 [Batrachochytrium dendrobatidis JAM81]EGF80288.1 hypothetical protein BATDEDRAFT_88993 [Batrachochytrium dendrobatidis JAM81]KAK5671325.1 hypothetical protein QVD99_002344 [Batrachochytrium dendrobatidis]|eukprot:XP_006679231.1 hypothetical protein BATDEDRAFT_88993 [Batrachochytrium dendrobatidis JAM81]
MFGAQGASQFGGASTAATPFGLGAVSTPAFPAATKPAAFGFGSSAPTSTAPSLFGAAPVQTAAPSLFGAAPVQTAAPSLFGAAPVQTATPSLFGAPAATISTGFGNPSGLGTATLVPKATTSSLPMFGNTAPAAAGGFGLFGQPAVTATPVASGLQLTEKTKYSEVPENVRQKIDEIERFIQQQIHASDSIGISTTDGSTASVSDEAVSIMQRLVGARNLIERDSHVFENLKKQVSQEHRNIDLASRFIERAQNGVQAKFSSPHQDAYSNYFTTFANDLEQRMQIYRQNIEEIELNVRNLMISPTKCTPQVIQDIIRDQYQGFVTIAGRVAQLHDQIDRECSKFAKFQQRYLGESKGVRVSTDAYSTQLQYQSYPQLNPAQQTRGGISGYNATGNEATPLAVIASTLQPTVQQGNRQVVASNPGNPAPSMFGGFGGGVGGSTLGQPNGLNAFSTPTTVRTMSTGPQVFGKRSKT